MARTVEMILQEQIGRLMFANATLIAQLEAVQEELNKLKTEKPANKKSK
jgi:hypothetical protein